MEVTRGQWSPALQCATRGGRGQLGEVRSQFSYDFLMGLHPHWPPEPTSSRSAGTTHQRLADGDSDLAPAQGRVVEGQVSADPQAARQRVEGGLCEFLILRKELHAEPQRALARLDD